MSGEVLGSVIVKFVDGQEQKQALRDGQEVRIGRDEVNDIVIADPGVSRFHSTLTVSENGVVLSDLASLNGTYINGERLTGMRDLGSRDLINIGSSTLRILMASDEITETMGSATRSRAMTAQMKPVSVSVLVVRLMRFRKYQEELPTDDIAEIQLSWMNQVREIVRDFDGEIDKVIGACMVALWVGNDSKNQALRAARSLQKVEMITSGLNQHWQYSQRYPIELQAVLSSGLGLKGALGADEKKTGGKFTIIGDPINSAFQLEARLSLLGKRFIIDSSSAELVGDAVPLVSLGKHVSLEGDHTEELFSFNPEVLIEG